MPGRQQLLGIWMLLTGGVFFAALAALLWLDSQLSPALPQRLGLWLLGLSPGLLLLLLGLLLEQRLFRPLRQFQVLLARLVASPDAQSDFPPSGWLQQLQPDFDHVREGWRSDRQRIHQARAEGAAEAARVRQQLEALVQLLELPLMICDEHQRLLLINPAARALFHDSRAPGLGRRIQDLLPHASLVDALRQLPADGSVRQLLLPGVSHWLRCELRRLDEGQGALIMLHDSTAELAEDLHWRRQLAALLPRLRGHAGSLGSTAEALSRVGDDTALRARFHQALEEDGRALAEGIDRLSRLLETRQLREHRLQQTWSNDLFRTLQEGLQREAIELTPVGIPVWLRVDGPTLVALLELLIRQLHRWSGVSRFDLEPLIGNGRIHLELSWQGPTPGESELSHWRNLPLFDDPLSPRVADVLDQHGSDFWSLPREGDQAALRLPLPAAERISPPMHRRAPRPEFHDFSIADLPPPDGDLAALELGQLEMIVVDTETTGLDLRGGIGSSASEPVVSFRDGCWPRTVSIDWSIPAGRSRRKAPPSTG